MTANRTAASESAVIRLHTDAGKRFRDDLTAWLQDTRLMSEAVHRLFGDYEKDGTVRFDRRSWPKPRKSDKLGDFRIKPVQLGLRMDALLKNLWSTRFVFLEALWEEYLQDLVKELRHKDASIFEPFCEREFMADVVRDVLVDRVASVDEIKDEVAARFATGITRRPWSDQWKQLRKLQIGLSEDDQHLEWFSELDVYFEMRNCVIHRQGRVSALLLSKSQYFRDNDIETIEIWPPHLDHYRHQFLSCLWHIEEKIGAKFASAP